MVSTRDGLVRVLIGCRSRCDSRARVRSIVRWAVVVSTGREGTSSGSRNSSSHLRVAETLGALLAAKELDAATTSVVVGGAWAVTLLLLMVTTERKLDESRNEEEKTVELSTQLMQL